MPPRHRAVTPRWAYVGRADTAVAPDRAIRHSTDAEFLDCVPDRSVAGSSAEGSSGEGNSAAGSSGAGSSGVGNSVADAPEGPAVAAEARTCPQNRRLH